MFAAHLGDLDRDLDAIGLARHRFYRQHAVRRATNWKLIGADPPGRDYAWGNAVGGDVERPERSCVRYRMYGR
jgi:hypothetical protein